MGFKCKYFMCQHLDHKVKITHVKLNKWSWDCVESLLMLCAHISKGSRIALKPGANSKYSTHLLEKLTVPQPVMKFHVFYET